MSIGKSITIMNEKYHAIKVAMRMNLFCCRKLAYRCNRMNTIMNKLVTSKRRGKADIFKFRKIWI